MCRCQTAVIGQSGKGKLNDDVVLSFMQVSLDYGSPNPAKLIKLYLPQMRPSCSHLSNIQGGSHARTEQVGE